MQTFLTKCDSFKFQAYPGIAFPENFFRKLVNRYKILQKLDPSTFLIRKSQKSVISSIIPNAVLINKKPRMLQRRSDYSHNENTRVRQRGMYITEIHPWRRISQPHFSRDGQFCPSMKIPRFRIFQIDISSRPPLHFPLCKTLGFKKPAVIPLLPEDIKFIRHWDGMKASINWKTSSCKKG